MAIIWAGKVFISFNLFAPKYCAIIADIAERVCAKIQNKADKKEPAIPTAAKAAVGLCSTLPTIAVSVIDNKGSAIPAIKAGNAKRFICLNVTFGFNGITIKRSLKKSEVRKCY